MLLVFTAGFCLCLFPLVSVFGWFCRRFSTLVFHCWFLQTVLIPSFCPWFMPLVFTSHLCRWFLQLVFTASLWFMLLVFAAHLCHCFIQQPVSATAPMSINGVSRHSLPLVFSLLVPALGFDISFDRRILCSATVVNHYQRSLAPTIPPSFLPFVPALWPLVPHVGTCLW